MNQKQTQPLPDQLEISVFGPGYGESILIHIGNGAWIAIDSCEDSQTKQSVPLHYIKSLGCNPETAIRFIVASHWHDDHVRGLHELLLASNNANFSCASVLTEKEFLALAKIYDDPTSKVAKGPKELHNCIQTIQERVIRTGQQKLNWSGADRVLCKSTVPFNIKLTSLSPSDEMYTRSLRFMAEYMNVVKKGYAEPKLSHTLPNDVAVALLLEINGRNILLGSDLEEEGKPLFGWSAVLNGNTIPGIKSSAFKVAHHGSKTGHHDGVWKNILEANPLALMTPFKHGSHNIPNVDERNRILALTNRAYISSNPNLNIKPQKKSNKVQTILNGTVANLRLAQGAVGHIRWRASINNPEDAGTIELFDGALCLSDVV